MDIKIEIANRAESINQILEKYLPEEEGFQKTKGQNSLIELT